MVKVMRKCPVCKKPFDIKVRRKACSTKCHSELISQTEKARAKKTKAARKPNNSHLWEPSPEEIAHQTALIRSGKVVISGKRVIYLDTCGTPNENHY